MIIIIFNVICPVLSLSGPPGQPRLVPRVCALSGPPDFCGDAAILEPAALRTPPGNLAGSRRPVRASVDYSSSWPPAYNSQL